MALPLSVPTTGHAATAYGTNIERGVNFRAAPSTNAYIFRMLPRGEDIHVIGKHNSSWLKVKVKDGTVGYISSNSKYTDYTGGSTTVSSGSTNSSSKANKIISLSKSLTSKVTYGYGVRNPSKYIFDCSSFVEYVFEQNGVDLPWGTKTLKNKGTFVSKSNLKNGDLVFFSTKGTAIDHVGIYIGNGQFIHNTPSQNGITINSLNSGYWEREYESARRVL